MSLRLTLLVVICIITTSCNKNEFSNVILGNITLSYDSNSSILFDKEFRYDSLFIDRVRKDSMVITRYLGGDGYCDHTMFSLIGHVFYENRIVPQIIMDGETETSIILIPIFLQKDTAFYYIPKDDFLAFFVQDLSFDKCKYQIKKSNKEFLTIKQSLTDTTYSEIYYYDQYYNIYKYINTWKNNKCVYVRSN